MQTRKKGATYRRTHIPSSAWVGVVLYVAPILLLAAVAHATPNVWTQLSPVLTSRRFPHNFVDCSQVISSRNPVGRADGNSVNGPSGTIAYWGGGHASHPGNDMELYNTATNTWTEQYVPECYDACCRLCSMTNSSTAPDSPPVQCETAATCPLGEFCPLIQCGSGPGRCAIAGTNHTGCSCSTAVSGSGTTMVSPLGRPYAEHIYQSWGYNANASRHHYLFSTSSGAWSYSPPTTWTLLTASQSPLQDNSPWCNGKLIMYDPQATCGSDTGAMLLFTKRPPGGGIFCFNYTTNHWDTFDGTLPSGMAGNQLVGTYDSTHNEQIISDSNTAIWGYKASTKTWRNLGAPAAAINTLGPFVADSVAYDPVHDITLVLKPQANVCVQGTNNGTGCNVNADCTGGGLCGPADMWQYNNATGTWSDVDDSLFGWGAKGSMPQENDWHWDNGTFYFLSAGGSSGGEGGTPDNLAYGTTTWSFVWDNPALVAAPTVTPTHTPTTAPTTTPTATFGDSPTPTVTPTITTTPTETPTHGPFPLTWDERKVQPGVLKAVGFHSGADLVTCGPYAPYPTPNTAACAYANSITGSSVTATYDSTEDAARFPVPNSLSAANFEYLDTYSWSGFIVVPIPWSQQFDENNEFEVQFEWKDSDWVTEKTDKKIAMFSAGNRADSEPPCQPSDQPWCYGLADSCMPNDVVFAEGQFLSAAHVPHLTGYQGCSSGPRWGDSYAGQIGTNFNDFVPAQNEYWYEPAIPSCTYHRVKNGTPSVPGVCTVPGVNVWQAVTMHWQLGPRGAGAFGGPLDWFKNSYFWLAFGWEQQPSRAMIYRGPFDYYSPISDTSFGQPPPKIGNLHLFPYRQVVRDYIRATTVNATTVTGINANDIIETFPAGNAVTDGQGGFATLAADAAAGATSISINAGHTLHQCDPVNRSYCIELWRTMKTGSRWYRNVLIATGGSLSDPFSSQPITWPVPPNSAAELPDPSATPTGWNPSPPCCAIPVLR